MLSGQLFLPSLAATLVADQALKFAVLTGHRASPALALGPVVRIRPIRTRRGMAGRLAARPRLLSSVWLSCLLAVLLIAPRAGRFDSHLAQIALGAALGGAAGNLIDVVQRKGVVDFIELGPWPAFNLADVAIVAGVIVALLVG